MSNELVSNKVEIFETISATTTERVILINGKQMFKETLSNVMDKQSTSNVKLFIDWLLGAELPLPPGATFVQSETFPKKYVMQSGPGPAAPENIKV